MEMSEDIKDRCIFVNSSRRVDFESSIYGVDPETTVETIMLCDNEKDDFIEQLKTLKRSVPHFPLEVHYRNIAERIREEGRTVGEDVIADIVADQLQKEWDEILPKVPISTHDLPSITITQEFEDEGKDIVSASLNITSSFDRKLNMSLEWSSMEEEMEMEERFEDFL